MSLAYPDHNNIPEGYNEFLGHLMPAEKAVELYEFMVGAQLDPVRFGNGIRIVEDTVSIDVYSDVFIKDSSIWALPDNLTVHGRVNIQSCPNLRSLPNNLHVLSLDVWDLTLDSFGSNTVVDTTTNLANISGLKCLRGLNTGGSLIIQVCNSLESLEGITVGSGLQIIECPLLRSLPADFSCKGSVIIQGGGVFCDIPSTVKIDAYISLINIGRCRKDLFISLKKLAHHDLRPSWLWEAAIDTREDMTEEEFAQMTVSFSDPAEYFERHEEEFFHMANFFDIKEAAAYTLRPHLKDTRAVFDTQRNADPTLLRDYFKNVSTEEKYLKEAEFVVRICIDQLKRETLMIWRDKESNGGAAATVKKMKEMNRQKMARLKMILPSHIIKSVTARLKPEDEIEFLELFNQQ